MNAVKLRTQDTERTHQGHAKAQKNRPRTRKRSRKYKRLESSRYVKRVKNMGN